jgi:hypothetical protein
MADPPNSDCPSAFVDMTLRLQRLAETIPAAAHWRWMLFDHTQQTNVESGHKSAGPVVSLGLPWLSADCSLRWTGARYFFWPQGIPSLRRVSIISSRLKQRLDAESWWFDLLRTATLRLDPAVDLLCAVHATAPCRYVCRAAELFGRPLLEFHADSSERNADPDDIVAWMRDVAAQAALNSAVEGTVFERIAEPPVPESYPSGARWSVFVSPPLKVSVHADREAENSDPETEPGNELSGLPIVDRILFAAGEQLQILRVRSGGAIQALLTHHVQDGERSKSLVMLASDASGQVAADVPDADGCVIPWLVKANENAYQSPPQILSSVGKRTELRTALGAALSDSSPLSHPADWLLHWTRSTIGSWPDQDEQEFSDELILGCRSADRSALATLLRILSAGCLRASSEAIRGGFTVVSFTAVPLHEFRRRRTYRRHRRRYDFEPWGIAVRRDVMAAAGARPVRYGDEQIWQSMTETERPFFQNTGTVDGWIEDEQEWRLVNSLWLLELPASAVIVFVDTEAAREIVQAQSMWPVIVVPESA